MLPAIIPFYRDHAQLERCLAHLRAQTCPVEPFVRDNSEENLFFTQAVNQGILRFLDAPCELMLVLNQDMYLEPGAVAALVEFMRSHTACGIAAPLQLDPRQPGTVVFGGTQEAFPYGRHLQGPLESFREPRAVPWANGACMLLRKRMIREIGLLDPNLRFLGSDSDYSFTARSRGWEVWVVPAARGVHEGGSSRPCPDLDIELRKLDDMMYFCRKWLNGDLYRSISFEGASLDPKSVQDLYGRMREGRRRLVTRLQERDALR